MELPTTFKPRDQPPAESHTRKSPDSPGRFSDKEFEFSNQVSSDDPLKSAMQVVSHDVIELLSQIRVIFSEPNRNHAESPAEVPAALLTTLAICLDRYVGTPKERRLRALIVRVRPHATWAAHPATTLLLGLLEGWGRRGGRSLSRPWPAPLGCLTWRPGQLI